MSSEIALRADQECPPLSKGKLRLYSMRFCPFAQRARLILEQKGIPFETVNINLRDKPQWFLDRNPKGEVPVLEQDGRIVYESLVVSSYVDKAFPGQSLTPDDPYRKARDEMLIDFYGSKYIPNFYKIIFSEGKDTDAAKALTAALQKLEEELAQRKTKFFGGENPAFVDFMIWPHLERLPVLSEFNPDVNLTSFPLVRQYREDMLSLPVVKKLVFDMNYHSDFYKKYRVGDKSAFDIGLPGAA